MRAIIYGAGKRFKDVFLESDFCKRVCADRMDIIGLADSNEELYGKHISVNGKSLKVCNVNTFTGMEFEQLIVSSKQYFNEIKEQLLKSGFQEDKIILMDDLFQEYYRNIFQINRLAGKSGVEIGGPSAIFSGIYEVAGSCDGVNFADKTVWWENRETAYCYQQKKLGKVIIDDAVHLETIENNTYDFLLSSNNMEHIANPLRALKEFQRVVKEGGFLYVVVPRKDRTFDHNREYTLFQHILDDYKNEKKETDLSHLPEIIEKHDYDKDRWCGGRDSFVARAYRNYENRCLHHHVFSPDCLAEMFRYLEIEVIDQIKDINNWIIIGRK